MYTKKYKRLVFTLILICTVLPSILHIHAQWRPKKEILILHSYNRGYKWTDGIEAGIQAGFAEKHTDFTFDYEYMDTKRYSDEGYYQSLYKVFKQKYSGKRFDIILASDNNALEFLVKHRNELFSDTPIVFCGINGYDPSMLRGQKMITGVTEEVDFKSNMELIKKLHPDTKKVLVTLDETEVNDRFIPDFEKLAKVYKGQFEIEIFQSHKLSEVTKKVRTLSKGEILFYVGNAYQNESGKFLLPAESTQLISDESRVPIYSAWDLVLGDGIVGGILASGYQQGKTAAELAQKILQNKSIAESPPIQGMPEVFMFDYGIMNRFNINQSDLPKGSILVNAPSMVYSIPKNITWAVVTGVILLLALINCNLYINILKRKKVEKALSQNEEMLRTLINGTPDAVLFKDAEGRWMEANEAALRYVGLHQIDYRGMTDLELAALSEYYQNTYELFVESDKKAWEKGSIYTQEEIIPCADGITRTFDVTKVPLFHSDGSRKGLVIMAHDITWRKEAGAALEEREEVLRATLNATADGILVVDNNRKIIDTNSLFLKMWEIPDTIFDFRDERQLHEYALKGLENPAAFSEWISNLYHVPKVETTMAAFKDGRIYEVYSAPLIRNGVTTGRVWSSRDITAYKQAEKELRESEERYRRLVELSPDAIYMSVGGVNIFANTAGAKLLGADSTEKIKGKRIKEFVHNYYDTKVEQKIKSGEGKAEGQILPLRECRLKRIDGTLIDVEIASATFDYKGQIAYLSVVRDITERKRAEELARKVEENTKLLNEAIEYDKLKTEFFANISHELRTPLNIILGTLQLFNLILNEPITTEKQEKIHKYVNIMRQNCYRLLRLVNNLIDVTRIDSGFFSIHLQNYDIVGTVENIAMSVVEYMQNKGIEFIFDTDIEEKVIACDVDKIERIILNLLSNAIKFTKPGGRITAGVEDHGDLIRITVTDTGIGIPEDKQHIIFDRFRQVDKSFIRNHEGSGIGLSLVKSLVELHGGRIGMESQWGQGSKFIIDLPVQEAAAGVEVGGNEGMYQSHVERINIEFSDIYF